MSTTGTFAFIEELKEPTSNFKIRWEKANVNPKTFKCQLRINESGVTKDVDVILDKYTTIDNTGIENICINFGIIESNAQEKVIVTVVRCENNIEHFLEEYKLLNSLYENVIINFEHFNTIFDAQLAF